MYMLRCVFQVKLAVEPDIAAVMHCFKPTKVHRRLLGVISGFEVNGAALCLLLANHNYCTPVRTAH